MSLNGALQVGRTALTVSQAGLQVAGNNMANVATPGFHRRSVHLTPLRGESIGRNQFVGRGVELESIRREVDTALQTRLRDAISDEKAAQTSQRFLSSVETLQNELSENDLSSLLSEFFNSFSELANSPTDNAVRSVVIQEGVTIAERIATLRNDYDTVAGQINNELDGVAETVNELLDNIEGLNLQILQSEHGVGEASALRDQRDVLIDELAQHFDITVLEQPSGSVDILVNSVPIMLAAQSRGVEIRRETVNGALEVSVRVAEDGTHIIAQSGTVGALVEQLQTGAIAPVVQTLDDLAAQLAFQVNRLHSQGQGEKGFTSVTGTESIVTTTNNLNLELPNPIENGSFFVHMTHSSTGQRGTFRIDVDGDAMSLDDLITEINTVVGVPNLTAGKTLSGELTLSADAGYEISFSDDSSGALASLGINTFFTGSTARELGVNQRLIDDPTLLAVAAGHVPGSNDTALAIANLQDDPVTELGGLSLRTFWQGAVNDLAVQTGAARNAAESTQLVRESLESQIQAVSGVSLDEESINLLMFQRQFQAAARFISVIDEALQILISIA